MALIEPPAYKAAKLLLECLCAELAANQNEDPTLEMPARCCLRAGAETLIDIDNTGVDYCCLGEAYVKVLGVYPSSNFPEIDEFVAGSCQMKHFTAQLELGVLRCIADSPTCEESDFAVRRALADAAAGYRAACCWGKALQEPINGFRRGTKWFAGPWGAAGPEGLCVSGAMTLQVSLPGISCC